MKTGLSLDRSLRDCLDCPHMLYRLAVWMEHRFSGTQHMTQNAAGVACSFLSLRDGRPLTISMNLHTSGQVRWPLLASKRRLLPQLQVFPQSANGHAYLLGHDVATKEAGAAVSTLCG